MGIYVHLFSFMIVVVTTFVRTTVVYTRIRLLVYCVCVCVCLLRAFVYCVCVRDLMQGLIGVLSLGDLSRKPRCNALMLNDLHTQYRVEIGWLLFLLSSLVASNVNT